MFINIEEQKGKIEGFCFTERSYDDKPGKLLKVTLPDDDDIFSIMSPRYDGIAYNEAFIYIQDIDKLIECLQALKKYAGEN